MSFMRYLASVTVVINLTSFGYGKEVSLLSGLYRSEKVEINDDNAGEESEFSFGARYAEDLDENLQWFIEAGLALRSYDAPSGVKDPSDSISIAVTPGVRWFFTNVSTVFMPFVGAKAGYVMDKSGDIAAQTETTTSGLFYWGSLGARLGLNDDLFVDFAADIFASALFATRETKGLGEGSTKTETTRSELFVRSGTAEPKFSVGVGLRI